MASSSSCSSSPPSSSKYAEGPDGWKGGKGAEEDLVLDASSGDVSVEDQPRIGIGACWRDEEVHVGASWG